MKKALKISAIIALLFIIVITSCKKDKKVETLVSNEINCYLTSVLEDDENITLSYNADNKLIKVTDSSSVEWFGTCEYNSIGQLVKMSSYNNGELSDYDTIIYNANGLPIELRSFWDDSKASLENKYLDGLFSHSTNSLNAAKYGRDRNNKMVLSSKKVFEYNGGSNIAKCIYYGYNGAPIDLSTSYSILDYDDNNNIIKTVYYQLDEDLLPYKKSEYTYSYDNKNHYFKNAGIPHLGYETHVNNILSFTNVRYENDTIYYSDSGEYVYEYNENDFPHNSKLTTENYTLSSFFGYDCK